MTEASSTGGASLHRGLPEEIVFWEILVRLPPKSLLRCRVVCRAWRHATSTRPFLQAHHRRQPSLPILSSYDSYDARSLLTFDHRAAHARLQPVVGLENSFWPEISCDGLLMLSHRNRTRMCYSICNPATRQHVPLPQLSGFTLLGMYAHRRTGEYRILLHRTLKDQTCCYIFVLGSNEPPRYIGVLEVAASTLLYKYALVHDSLHWYPLNYRSGSQGVIAFDDTSESFRKMRAPIVPNESYIIEINDTLGIYSCSNAMKTVDIWVLHNYKSEVWTHKYNVKFSDAEIKGPFGQLNDNWEINVETVDGDVLLLVGYDGRMFYVDIDGKLVENFHHNGQFVYTCEVKLKQTLVQHTFFTSLEGYAVNASPFV